MLSKTLDVFIQLFLYLFFIMSSITLSMKKKKTEKYWLSKWIQHDKEYCLGKVSRNPKKWNTRYSPPSTYTRETKLRAIFMVRSGTPISSLRAFRSKIFSVPKSNIIGRVFNFFFFIRLKKKLKTNQSRTATC